MIELNNIQQPKKFTVLLVGDSCIDEYHYGTVDRLSPEAPVPVFKHERTETKPGMAANVQSNLIALGCDVDFVTNSDQISKTRFIDKKSGYQLLRADKELPLPPWTGPINLNWQSYDAVVISDYNKGFVTYDSIEIIKEHFKGPIFIDTKKNDLEKFEGCFVKINEMEFNLRSSICKDLIVTLGSRGAMYGGEIYPAPKVEVFDVCGAGDTFLSALAYQYLNLGSIEDAIQFAIQAAAVTVGHLGVYSPTLEEIL